MIEITFAGVTVALVSYLGCLIFVILLVCLVGAAILLASLFSPQDGDQSKDGDQRTVSQYLLSVYDATDVPAQQKDRDPVVMQMKKTAVQVQQQGEKAATQAKEFIKTIYGGKNDNKKTLSKGIKHSPNGSVPKSDCHR